MPHPHERSFKLKKNKFGNIIIFKISTFIIIFLIMGILDYTLSFYVKAKNFEDEKESVRYEIEAIRSKIEDELGKNLYILFGMASYISVRSGIKDEEFENLSKRLLSESNSLSNIAIAPGFIIKNVFPYEKHKQIIGLDYRNNPKQWPEAKSAKDNRTMVIAGPIKLIQGGEGLVARVPVFTNNETKFWGLVSALFDFKTLLKNSGIMDKKALNISIKGKHSKGIRGEVFYGDSSLFDEKENSIKLHVNLPNGFWIIAAKPVKGWNKNSRNILFIHIFFIIISVSLYNTITRLHFAKTSLEDSAFQFKAMSKASHDALIIIDSDDNIKLWNPAAEKMFNYSEEEMKESKMHEYITLAEDKDMAYKGFEKFRYTGKGPIIESVREVRARRKGGSVFPVELSVASFRMKDKWFAVGSIRDVTQRKEYEEELTRLATTDSLTNLCNRRHFMELSEIEFERTKRYDKKLSLLMLDIDHFKKVNDSYGHDVGDLVLISVAKSLNGSLRNSDITGRLGGEEFSVLLPETELESAKRIAERIRTDISKLTFTGREELNVTISIGLTDYNGADSVSDMLKVADNALYQAKNEGRNRVVVNSCSIKKG